jgi:hypothetical protein
MIIKCVLYFSIPTKETYMDILMFVGVTQLVGAISLSFLGYGLAISSRKKPSKPHHLQSFSDGHSNQPLGPGIIYGSIDKLLPASIFRALYNGTFTIAQPCIDGSNDTRLAFETDNVVKMDKDGKKLPSLDLKFNYVMSLNGITYKHRWVDLPNTFYFHNWFTKTYFVLAAHNRRKIGDIYFDTATYETTHSFSIGGFWSALISLLLTPFNSILIWLGLRCYTGGVFESVSKSQVYEYPNCAATLQISSWCTT